MAHLDGFLSFFFLWASCGASGYSLGALLFFFSLPFGPWLFDARTRIGGSGPCAWSFFFSFFFALGPGVSKEFHFPPFPPFFRPPTGQGRQVPFPPPPLFFFFLFFP